LKHGGGSIEVRGEHEWWVRPKRLGRFMTDLQKIWLGLGLLVPAVFVYWLQPILTPFLMGALLAYLGDPLADRLEALGMGRTQAVCIVFFTLTGVLLLTVLLTVPMIGHQLDVLANKIPQWLEAAQLQLLPQLQALFGLPQQALPMGDLRAVVGDNWQGAGQILTRVWGQLAGSSMALVAVMVNVLLIPVVTFYLLRDWDLLTARIRALLPRSAENTVVTLAVECDEILGAFIRGQLLVMLALTVVYALGLSIVGLDLALLLGLIAGLASIVPYMGFIVGILAACIAAYFQFHEWLPLLAVAGVFAVGQLLEAMVLTPILVGDRIGLHPVAVIFAIMAGGQLAGFTGVLLALPVAASIMVLLRPLPRSYTASDLYRAGRDSQ
jgi:predicted PurR-regulated permease PerM